MGRRKPRGCRGAGTTVTEVGVSLGRRGGHVPLSCLGSVPAHSYVLLSRVQKIVGDESGGLTSFLEMKRHF